MQESEVGTDTILVALDGSPSAQAAAGIAIQIAQAQKLELQGLYVVDETLVLETYANCWAELGSDGEFMPRAELVARFEEQGERALGWLELRCVSASVPVRADLFLGRVPRVVLERAPQAMLLALGRRGRGHAADPTHLGRYFRAIAHHTHLPMLVGGNEQSSAQRLLLAYNGSQRARQALVWASRLHDSLHSEVIALAVQENQYPSQLWLSEMQVQIKSAVTDYRFQTRLGQPASEIVSAAVENEVDLIVMGGYRHTAIAEWLLGSTLDRVLRHTALPVLVA